MMSPHDCDKPSTVDGKLANIVSSNPQEGTMYISSGFAGTKLTLSGKSAILAHINFVNILFLYGSACM